MNIIDNTNEKTKIIYYEVPKLPFVIEAIGDKEKYLITKRVTTNYDCVKLTGSSIGVNFENGFSELEVLEALNENRWKLIPSKLILGEE